MDKSLTGAMYFKLNKASTMFPHPAKTCLSSMAFSTCLSPFNFTTFFLILSIFVACTKAQVPANQTFRVVNQGEFGDYITEYDAGYRVLSSPNNNFFAFPFRLCFYNTTPTEFILAIRAGVPNDEDLMRWVWDANRNRPVKENATVSFGREGNLVLADVDGSVVWQTNTANKGVTGLQLLPNGNLVLYDKKGKFIWQSFDYPVDTLLAGMSLVKAGRNKLVSRTSEADGRDGKYSLILEDSGLNLYLTNNGHLLRYNGWTGNWGSSVKFDAAPTGDNATFELLLIGNQDTPPAGGGGRRLFQSVPADRNGAEILIKLDYNATITFIRLESDGNIKGYTYFAPAEYAKWSETFAYFSPRFVRECGRPSKCGAYGLCDKGMCVACPSPKGLSGWDESCAPPKLKPCPAEAAAGGGKAVNYYKIVGVEHFLSPSAKDGEGPLKVEDCRAKCSKDCSCKGFIYKEDTKKCLNFPVLGTLIKDANTTSVGYIKF